MRFFSKKIKRSFPSTSAIIPSILSAKEAKALLAQQIDPREIFKEAAEMKGISESKLMEALARQIGLPFATTISRAQEETEWDAAYLSRGALPEVIDGITVGAYAIDPYRIRDILPEALAKNIVIVSWSCLTPFVSARASQDNAPQSRQTGGMDVPDCRPPLSTDFINLLSLILDEASSFGLSQANLTITPRGISYLLQLSDGESLTGLLESPGSATVSELKEVARQGNSLLISHNEQATLSEITPDHFLLKKEIIPAPFDYLSEEQKYTLSAKSEVLLVEDDPAFSAIVAAVLEEGDYGVTVCRSVGEAIISLQQKSHPSAIITDLNVIDSVGKETIDRLIRESGISPSRIIVLSNEENGQLEASLVRLGLKGVLPKHRDPEVLLAHLDWVTRGQSQGNPDKSGSTPVKGVR